MVINGEVQDTTKDGKVKFQFAGDTFLTGKLPSGEEVHAIKMEKLLSGDKVLLLVDNDSPHKKQLLNSKKCKQKNAIQVRKHLELHFSIWCGYHIQNPSL